MWIASLIRRKLENVLEGFGYSLKLAEAPPRGYQRFLRLYRSAAPPPKTVFDIGVGEGTPWLYEAFPAAHFVLVEALEDFRPAIERILQKYDAECHYCCLGETEGEAEFRVRAGLLTSSGMHALNEDFCALLDDSRKPEEKIRRIPMRTLDSIAPDCPTPLLLKIDVEGAEMGVLKGGVNTVRSADMILVETSIASRFQGGSDLIQVGSWLQQFGFGLFEIVNFATVGPRRITSYVDAVFVRRDSEAWRNLMKA
jgi:FkbM family methyltransferase